MEVSDKLAYEIYTIILFHWIAILLLFGFSAVLVIQGKKSQLKNAYILVVSLISIWLIAKMLKTVSPNIQMRWFFIVLQYFAIEFLGAAFLVFAWCYKTDKLPRLKQLIFISLPPSVSFIIVLTNPIHMKFYSYFDFYRDRFGAWFLPIQSIQYLYLFAGAVLLIIGYRKEVRKAFVGRVLATLSLLAMLLNLYYIAFKMSLIEWIFPFPVFDITPLALTLALLLFMATAYEHRFLDISPISIRRTFSFISKGVLYVYADESIYKGNLAFYRFFPECQMKKTLLEVLKSMPFEEEKTLSVFYKFIKGEITLDQLDMMTSNGRNFKVTVRTLSLGIKMICFSDLTQITKLSNKVKIQNEKLNAAQKQLEELTSKQRDLAIMQLQNGIAQDVHDILGHSLTVVIGTTELAAMDADTTDVTSKMSSIKEMLINSLADLRNALTSEVGALQETSLIKAIESLENDSILLDFSYQGQPVELSSLMNETLYRLCQEAITNAIRHGEAKNITIVLRYQPKQIELFAVDDGRGCEAINLHYGLRGIQQRAESLGGKAVFRSDGQMGFHIHVILPINP
ncbi:sensor histidine kinase [Fusibacter bizertensis]